LTASDTSTIQSQPQTFVGPGGAGANYCSGPATQGPDGLHLCTENTYDWARFGPVSFCAGDVPLAKAILTNAGACLIGGVGAYVLNSGQVVSNGVAFSVGCLETELVGWWEYAVGALASPAQSLHSGEASADA
jgi:hypothetical protein